MKFIAVLMTLCVLSISNVSAQNDSTNQSAKEESATDKLNNSPRHLDWVTLKSGDRNIKCFIAYPEIKEKATSVIVIHEIFGLSDWVRTVCDQLAKEGYIAIAPDLLSGKAGEDTSKYIGVDAQRKAVTSLPAEQVTHDLDAVAEYTTKLPAANGKLAVAGFCWGGKETFRYATNNPAVKDAFVFYGTPPENAADIARIQAKVFGFYGENDARVTSTIEKATAMMKEAKKSYEPKVYAGAGHGFMRTGEQSDAKPADKTAKDESWKRLTELLGQIR